MIIFPAATRRQKIEKFVVERVISEISSSDGEVRGDFTHYRQEQGQL